MAEKFISVISFFFVLYFLQLPDITQPLWGRHKSRTLLILFSNNLKANENIFKSLAFISWFHFR
jgi:hypothetical protein